MADQELKSPAPVKPVAPKFDATTPGEAPKAQPGQTESPKSAASPARPKRQRVRTGLFALLPVALLVAGYLYVTGGQIVSTDNAYIQADHVGVSTDVSGLVATVEVKDNQRVSKGQVLFTLKPEPFRIALASAQAQLGNVRNQILNLKANYNQALAEIDQAQIDLAYYQTSFQRQQTLVNVSAVSKTNYDDAKHALDSTRQKIAVAKATAQMVLAQLGGHIETPVEQQSLYLQAQAAVDEAQRNLDNSVVRASFDGIVTNVDSLQVGSYLQPPQSGISLVSADHLWVAASPKETELTHMQPGQPVDISVDSYPGVQWHGTVESISPASGASFSLLPAQNTTGNWVKVVQRIPVRISIDDADGKPALRTGMSVQAEIDTGSSRGLPHLFAGLTASKAAAHE
ncbi:HlyD family secretion protein [Pseudomonas vancouverensis]|uniref:HlyD family secretion protein n=1 Tax=Pseudomonas vancouverensis TaxID=95300 RepID=A0A1H2NFM1_PSEVA|nr:HlyD family secretion protein [Pseudomonas vancouverensis]KAB0494303.1 HlyD family secretion protein [Pseudomonas vancouverensis]TDB60611.1 HlyD family secretion protein [Pseudomonas vancouverensis]SDV04164.1 membrane fusion protein, multidrug efflux system [Pseudomonas vancouverensis]